MNRIERDIYVTSYRLPVMLHYVQGTNTIPIVLNIRDYDIPSGSTARVYVKRPDGTVEYDNAAISGNTVTVSVKKTMFSVVGNSRMQICIAKGENVLVSFEVIVDVRKNHAYSGSQSENNTDIFDKTLEEAEEAAQNARTAAQNIQDRADRGDFTSTVQIGSVTTGAAGTEASVSNSGTDKDVVLNLTIPRGDKGVSMYMAGAWNSGTEYVNSVSRIDIVTCNGSTYGCRQTHTSSQDNAPAGEENEYWLCLARKGDTGNIENIDTIPIAFSEAAEPENLESGDSVTTVFGKIKKWFSDLSNGAASTLLGNNLQEGKVLVSDETGKVSVSEVTQKQLEDRPNAFQSSTTIPVTSGWLKIAKLPRDAMLRTDIPDSETLAVSFSCTPTADTGDYDQACRFVITETWAGSKVRVLNSAHAGDAVVTQVRKVSDDTDQMYYLELEVNVPSCPCKLDVSFESGVIPWEPEENIPFDTDGEANEIYSYKVTEDRFANLELEISKKQNILNITPNSIPDLDSFWEGLTWYNADQNPAGDKPFENYGFVLAFTTGANHIQIGIPFGGMTNENLRVRSWANKRWYGWKSISRRHVEVRLTANIGNIVHQNCFINLETSEVFIYVTMNNITGTITTGTAFCTIPTAFLPVKEAYGTASARISGAMITSCGMVDKSGAIRQLISSSTSSLDIFTFSCTYYISET